MQCDMCGRSEEHLYLTDIEGTQLQVCKSCVGYGRVIKKVDPDRKVFLPRASKPKKEEPQLQIVDDCADLVRLAREKQNLNHMQFARKLNIKESMVHSLESGNFTPSINLARKLERILHVTLIEDITTDEVTTPTKGKSGGSLTIGDILKVKKN